MVHVFVVQETTLFLQMLYDHEFKQQFSEELVVHYAALIKLVITNVVEGQPNSLKDFKALDSSLDRGMSKGLCAPPFLPLEPKLIAPGISLVLLGAPGWEGHPF